MNGAFAALTALAVSAATAHASATLDGAVHTYTAEDPAVEAHASAIGDLALTPGAATLVAAAGALALVGRRRDDSEAERA